jgi:hypothetical protein
MSDVMIFAFGTGVFGIALAATMVISISPSQKDAERRRMSEKIEQPNPSYTP